MRLLCRVGWPAQNKASRKRSLSQLNKGSRIEFASPRQLPAQNGASRSLTMIRLNFADVFE